MIIQNFLGHPAFNSWILLVTRWYGDPTTCGAGPSCQITRDKTRIQEASAVIVFLNTLPPDPAEWIPLDYTPHDNQKWVIFTPESPQDLP